MASAIPYTYFQCPCAANSATSPRRGVDGGQSTPDEDPDESGFDPRAPRSGYRLYPLEHLLYCEDCQQIRCPRCVLEEIVTWYCPNCLFEVPSSSVKSEGTRCTRSCFECPCCTAPLSVTSVDPPPSNHLSAEPSSAGSYILNCSYCAWNTKEIGIQFEKPNNIHAQLSKIKNGGARIVSPVQRRLDQEEGGRKSVAPLISGEEEDADENKPADNMLPEIRFANLRSFYQSQLAEASPVNPLNFGADYGYGSPSSLSRIMGLYTSGSFSASKPKTKIKDMREALDASEGLAVFEGDADVVTELQTAGWAGTTSHSQRASQTHNPRFNSELRPIPYLLRTKRSKRCKSCRHILTKPESKISNTRFRIRLVALNYIPSMSIKPLQPPAIVASTMPSPPALVPYVPTQFLLTLINPLFEAVKITLATPSHTPGRVSTRVTILCPEFDIGANTDVWDEALAETSKDRKSQKPGDGGDADAEAGKVWARGRNWCSVVVEVVPGPLREGADLAGLKGQRDFVKQPSEKETADGLGEDEDVLEIPMFVRVEWETDAAGDETTASKEKDKDAKEKRELAYWSVLGVGRIADA